jgi:2-hydroxychromene-2-carboxylate isomerase
MILPRRRTLGLRLLGLARMAAAVSMAAACGGIFVLMAAACGGIFVLMAAACGGSHGSAPGAVDSKSAARGPRIDEVSQVDTSQLTDAEKSLWSDLINDQLSPCGDPVSIAKCANEKSKCGACVTAARYLARLVMEGYDRTTLVEHYRTRFGSKDKAALPLDDSPSRGAPMAKVTLVEFSDFQCPHCAAAHPELMRVLREFDGRVRLVYKYFPLSNHTRAVAAAQAAEAARAQGKFWEMHDLLFEHQRELEEPDILKYAAQLGLDMERFTRDLNAEVTVKRVEADKALGQKLGIEATPSFFVDARPFRESPRNLAAYIREELEL